MTALQQLQNYWVDNQFNDLFIQLFVETNGRFNYRFFNKFHETKFSHTEINAAIQDLTGSKVIQYREVDFTPDCFGFELFKKAYKFGKFEDARQWVHDFWYNTDIVPSRVLILNWIAKQHPPKTQSSFLPTDTGNLYHDRKEKSLAGADEGMGE